MEIQLFFSILIVQSIDKFLIGSHCLSIWNNMTKKQQTQHGAIEKVCHLHNKFFYPIHLYTLCQSYSITSPVLFTKNIRLWNEWKEDFLYIWLLRVIWHHVISKELKNHIFRHNCIFRHTCMHKHPMLKK